MGKLKIWVGALLWIFLVQACTSWGSWQRGKVRIALAGNLLSSDQEGTLFSNLTIDNLPEGQEVLLDTLREEDFWEQNLKQYSTLILLDDPMHPLSSQAQNGIQRYLEGGGGLLLLRSEEFSEEGWAWYSHLISTASDTPSVIRTSQPEKELSSFFSYQSGRIAFLDIIKPKEGLGDLAGSVEKFQEALTYTIGDNRYYPDRIISLERPDESRFSKVVLDSDDVNEPMELTFLDQGKVLYIERRGKMKVYDPLTQSTQTIANFREVCTEGNYEDGLLGVEADPNFEQNRYLYLYYSPPCNIKEQYLSRFYLDENDSLHRGSEKVILKVPVQRETCCHSGGAIAFGPEGNLYLSTGDNTSSKESDGFSPLDERPGRAPFDAQKSSGNTHDLRGKILRIRVHDEGTYSIPEGNLFPKDGSEGRPEIYVMGARNPFRISIDAQTQYVYWGDVGPDGTQDGKYGPQSFDEFNQAKKAGNFGWPFFVGNNFAYRFRDFAQDTVGSFFDPEAPINRSPNNTGDSLLPPAQPAWIWYSKRRSKQFPHLGRGSNSAMAGPIFYKEAYDSRSPVRFPAYFDGKLFLYEWARSWINVVEMDETGAIQQIEPFLRTMDWVKPIDMEFGPDGALYVLEYGQNYFLNNPEAKLSRIEYAPGNREPVPQIWASVTQGSQPLTVEFSAENSYDVDTEDSLSFQWIIAGKKIEGVKVSYEFVEKGIHEVILMVKDSKQSMSKAEAQIQVGNTPPEIQIAWDGNRSFYQDRSPVPYEVTVKDPEDQANGGIPSDKILTKWTYLSDRDELKQIKIDPGREIPFSFQYVKGKKLVESSDCLGCHAFDTLSVGPSYMAVAERYSDQVENVALISKRIALGSNGVWGEKMMPGHPQHSQEEIEEMVKYVLSLNDESPNSASLPASGAVETNPLTFETQEGVYILSASYQDKGAGELPSIKRRELLVLRNPRVEAEAFDKKKGLRERAFGADRSQVVLTLHQQEAYLGLMEVDLRDLKQLTIHMQQNAGMKISAKLDSLEGPQVGSLSIRPETSGKWESHRMAIEPRNGFHNLFLLFEPELPSNGPRPLVDWVEFGF